jgi:FkbM family methyltransferase
MSLWEELSYLARLGDGVADRVRLPWAGLRFHLANRLGLAKHFLDRPAESFRLQILGGHYPMRLRPYNGDWFIFLDTLFNRRYAGIARLADPIRTVVDLGCHVGSSTLSLALLAPEAQFFCLEANPGNVALLTHNLAGLGSRARVLSGALNEKPGIVTFSDDGLSWGGSMDARGSRTYQVPAYTLAQVIEKAEFPTVDVLKVHVEGAERYIFQESQRAALRRVRLMVVAEFHDDNYPEERFLADAAGFGFEPHPNRDRFLALVNRSAGVQPLRTTAEALASE